MYRTFGLITNQQLNQCPEYKGIKTLSGVRCTGTCQLNQCPEYKGIKTQQAARSGFIAHKLNQCPEYKGIKTGAATSTGFSARN